MGLIGARILGFNVGFQKIEHIVGQLRQLVGDRLELLSRGGPRNLAQHRPEGSVDLLPVGRPLPSPTRRDTFLDAGGNHLGDVAPAKRDALAHKPQRVRLCFDVGRQVLELL
jgi:hypothetical protein